MIKILDKNDLIIITKCKVIDEVIMQVKELKKMEKDYIIICF